MNFPYRPLSEVLPGTETGVFCSVAGNSGGKFGHNVDALRPRHRPDNVAVSHESVEGGKEVLDI